MMSSHERKLALDEAREKHVADLNAAALLVSQKVQQVLRTNPLIHKDKQ